MLSILGALLLSFVFVSGASAGPPHYEGDGGGATPKPPTCTKYPCPERP